MTEPQVIAFMLILTRVSAFVGFFTLFSFRQLPQLVKVGMAVGLSVFWIGQYESTVNVMAEVPIGLLDSVLMLAREFIIGLMLAIALNLFFMPCKIAGAYVGQELGLSLASVSSPGTPDSATLVTRVFETFTILIFFSLELHHFLIMAIDFSFKHLTGKINPLSLPVEQLVSMLNDTSDYGLMVIAPVAVILMVVTLSISLLNRAAPTMNLFSVGIGVRTGLGIFCLAMLLPVIFGSLRGYLLRIQNELEQLLLAFQ